MNHNELFWTAPVQALKLGVLFDPDADAHVCLLCGARFDNGVIYPEGDGLYMAEKAARRHVQAAHGGMFDSFLRMNKAYSGVTEHQAELMRLFYSGLSDREIVERTSANSTSTIRNQRFALREKHKQARIIVAMMELLEERLEKNKMSEARGGQDLAQFHRTASMIDERYAITEAEKAEVLGRYFDAEDKLKVKAFPAREKRKIIILQHIAGQFAPNEQYTEKQVNEVIARHYEDVATVRRYLIEYGFLDRKKDGSAYWLKL